MPDTLRTRIAAALCGDYCVQGMTAPCDDCRAHSLRQADAVIRELGLELEAWKPENHSVVNGLHNMGIDPAVIYRYNTKWMTR